MSKKQQNDLEQNTISMYSESRIKKTEDGGSRRSISWKDADGVHTETTIINKKVPSVWTILLTALVFTIVGAFIASLIFFARYADVEKLAIATRGSDPSATAPIEPDPTTPSGSNDLEIVTPAPQPTPANSESSSSGFANSIPDLYEKNVSGVVIVDSYEGNSFRLSNLVGTGTGFCISENGYVLTNAHVVEDANKYQIRTFNGVAAEARLIGADVRTDIAVLKIDDPSILTVMTIGDSAKVRTGDFVFAIGHPTGEELSFTATFGMVGAVDRSVVIDGVKNDYIQIDAAINPGNSGGPLFDMNGNVIGVNTAKTVIASYDEDGEPISAEGLGFALPINMAIETAQQIIRDGGIERPGIGISTIFITEERAEQYSIPVGALVYTITKDGPGHKCGLQLDDIIISADDHPIEDSDTLGNYIRSTSVGDTVKLKVWRDGSTIEIEIVIGNLNELGSEILDDAHGGERYGLQRTA